MKRKAEVYFSKIHTAYNGIDSGFGFGMAHLILVLTDAALRSIYDEHGTEGVEAAKQLGEYLDGDLERLKEEIDRFKRDRLDNVIRKKTVIAASVDASIFTENYSTFPENLHWTEYVPAFSRISLSQKFEFPFLAESAADVTLGVASQSGSGSGNISAALSRQFGDRIRGRLEFGLAGRRFCGIGFSTSLSKRITADVYSSATFYGGDVLSNGQVTLSGLVGEENLLSITFISTQGNLGVSLGYNHLSEVSPVAINLQVHLTLPHSKLRV